MSVLIIMCDMENSEIIHLYFFCCCPMMCSRFLVYTSNFQARNCSETTWIHSLCSLEGKGLMHLSSRSWQMLGFDSCKFIITYMQVKVLIAYINSHHLLTVSDIHYVCCGNKYPVHCGKASKR